MALTKKMQLKQHEKTFATGENGVQQVIEHVQYALIVEDNGEVIAEKPHRIVLDRSKPTAEHTMPDGTVKTTAEIVVEIDG